MNSFRAPIVLSFLVSLAIIVVSYADQAEDDISSSPLPDENKFSDVVNKTGSGDDVEGMIIMMPTSEKAVMMLNSGKQKASCYVCSRPCSSIYCCNDGFPQCCSVNGYCGCCG